MKRAFAVGAGLAILLTTALYFGPGARAQVPAASPAQPKRIALLVGNMEYARDGDRLTGPLMDAATIQRALSRRGFVGMHGERSPSLKQNVTLNQLVELVASFKDAIKDAGPDAIGFFYYAGHGIADAHQSYLVPVDAPDIRTADENHRLSIYDVTGTLSQALKPGQPSIVVVIDACRTGVQGGKAPPDAVPLKEQKPGMLLALSAGIGQPAGDLGDYAKALAAAIETPGLTLEGVFDQVARDVWEKSQHAQLPVYAPRLVKKVCLVSCEAATVALTDPREILAHRGVLWTVDAFFDAIRRGELETVKMFLAGQMATGTVDTQGRSLPVILSLDETNPEKMLDLLLAGGVKLETRYGVWAPQGDHRKTLLERAVEHGNLRLVKALVARGARVNDPMQTYGGMGVTVKTYPLVAALTFDHFDIASALLDGGADPRVGDWAAYREAQSVSRRQPGYAREIQALLPRLAPPPAEQARLEAQPRQAVDQCVRKILATPAQQLYDEASHFNVFSHLTLGARECVLAKINAGLVVGDRGIYRNGYIGEQAQACCHQSYGSRP